MAMFEAFFNSGGVDVLSRTMQFAGRRHELITNNIANLSTPNYRPQDVDPGSFQEELGRAIKARRSSKGQARHGELRVKSTEEVQFGKDSLRLEPKAAGQGILFHDRNDRDLERTMQSLAENVMVYRQASELLASRFRMMESVIRERP